MTLRENTSEAADYTTRVKSCRGAGQALPAHLRAALHRLEPPGHPHLMP